MTVVSSESILAKCGGCGFFQGLATMVVLLSRLTCALLVLLPVYISHKQPVLCHLSRSVSQDVLWSSHNFLRNTTFPAIEVGADSPRNMTLVPEIVEVDQIFCSSKTLTDLCFKTSLVSKPFFSTLREQFQLWCSDRYMLPAVASTCCMSGIFLASFLVGSLSDNYGRLIVLSISGFVSGVSSLLALLAPYFWMHSLSRFFVGVGVAGLFSAGNSYIIEVIPLKQRLPLSLLALGGWNVGNFVLCLIAFFIRSHWNIQVVVTVFTFHSTLYYFLMPESYRWLISMGKKELAIKSIVTMAKINRHKVSKTELENDVRSIISENESSKRQKKTEQLQDVLHFKNVRAYLAIFWTLFFIVSLVYYILSLSSGRFSEDVFLGAFSVAATTLMTRAVIIFIGLYLGRVPVLSSLSATACILLLVVGILKWTKNGSTTDSIFLVSATFLSEASFSWVWIYSAEVFPTVIRTACVSTSSGFARLGALVAPQLLPLNEMYPGIAYVICGFLMFFNFLLPMVKLPETRGFVSVDYLKDAEQQLLERERVWMKCFQKEKKDEEIDIKMDTSF